MQAPSLTSFVALVIIIAGSGVAFDKLVLSSRLDTWRRSIGRLWIKLNTPGAKALAQDANQLYCDLFDYIYGKRAFTWRRVWASVLSSMIGLVVITLILGYENTLWPDSIRDIFEKGIRWGLLVILLLCPVFFNLIPDFFSLFETRLVLKWSKEQGPLGIVLLIILDLALTTTIFLVGALLIASLPLFFYPRLTAGEVLWEFYHFFILSQLFRPDGLLLFFLTTFITSFFWILFVITFGLIWVFHRLSPLANLVYYQIGQSDRPAAALSAFLNGIIIIIYAVWRVLEWAIVS
jgi:hypothetical protein